MRLLHAETVRRWGQVRASVASAVALLTAQEEEVLAEVRAILAPVRDATWPSGRPENN